MSAKLAQNLSGRELPAGREPAGLAPGQPDFGVAPTDPVQHEDEFVRIHVDVDHDLFRGGRPALSCRNLPD
jgi:hypothetical protein